MTDVGRERVRVAVLLTGVFATLTVGFTYPISLAPNTYLNALGDARLVAWILAWDAHALITDPLRIFDANIFFPNRGTLAFSENFIGTAISVAPLNWAGYPVLAYNLALMSSFFLCGIGAALWVRHLTGSLAAGILAGLIWAFAPAKFEHIVHLHLLTGQWIPFALLFATRYVERHRRRDLVICAVFSALQFAFSMHLGVYLVFFLPLYAATLIAFTPQGLAGFVTRRRAADAAVAGGLFTLLTLPIALPHAAISSALGLERSYAELADYSARPMSFLAGSRWSSAPHVSWLYDRFGTQETSAFPGLVAAALAAFAVASLLRRLWRTPRSAAEPDEAVDNDIGSLRRRVFRSAVILGTAFLLLHLLGLALAVSAPEASLTALLVLLSTVASPALGVAVAATLAVFTLSPTLRRRCGPDGKYLLVIAYLALIAYLLTYGPEVHAGDARLGYGPYWLLYQVYLPLQSIRAVGRIGFLWLLFVAALAGFGFAALERRLGGETMDSSHAHRLRAAWVALAVVGAVMVWESRVTLRAVRADPSQDPVDSWLADQPGDFAVVHVPIPPAGEDARETRYMLGSTLHWKRLVNGFSGYSPPDYRELVAAGVLTEDFFRRLRADFPVRFLIVHGELLRRRQRRLVPDLAARDDIALVDQLGETLVYEVRRDRDAGPSIRRRYLARDLSEAGGISFDLRGPGVAGNPDAVVLAGWGDEVEQVGVSAAPETRRFPLPSGYVASLRGNPGSFQVAAHNLVPVGATGARVAAGFQIDVQRGGVGVALDGRWLWRGDAGAYQVLVVEQYGARVAQAASFPRGSRGEAAMRDHIAALPVGTLVAIGVSIDPPRPPGPTVVDALRMVGAVFATDDEAALIAVLGARGAPPGDALQHASHQLATIEFDAPALAIEAADIRLY